MWQEQLYNLFTQTFTFSYITCLITIPDHNNRGHQAKFNDVYHTERNTCHPFISLYQKAIVFPLTLCYSMPKTPDSLSNVLGTTNLNSYIYKKKHLYHFQENLNYNLGHNILRLFDVLPNFSFPTSETNRDY